ncbi:MAG: thioesterase family protein [Propionibacterium sp.]|nr:thioesterase family protein [Propionibacterium sp.]
MADFYYTALGDGWYEPTLRAQGAWRPDEQHMSPVSGLLVHCLLRHEPRAELQLARVTFEILGVMRALPTHIVVETIRPGRSIELTRATAVIDGRAAVQASAWFLADRDTEDMAHFDSRELPHAHGEPEDLYNKWDGGFIRSLQVVSEPGKQPGRGWSWLRTDTTLVDGEPVHPTAALLMLADTANGVAPLLPPREWTFPNIDLTIHLLRQPTGEWLGLDVTNNIGPTGVGITSAVLHDVHGPFGRSEQILTVDRAG